MNGDIVWQPAMVKCVCGHFHADSCPCGCTIYQPDDGNEGGPVPAGYATYRGQDNQHYTLEENA